MNGKILVVGLGEVGRPLMEVILRTFGCCWHRH